MSERYVFLHDTDFMREWVELGDSQENPYMRFMAYWVAFNMLYAGYYPRGNLNSEKAAIEKFLKENEPQFSRYDPFSNGDADLFCSAKLFQLYDWSERRINAARRAIEEGDVVTLMNAVYRVRCNFFHGNKKLDNPTDREFVTAAATIVRGYLGTFGLSPNASGTV